MITFADHPVHPVPPMTHPLSKHWDQPERKDVHIDETTARMSKATYDALKNYSLSMPSGAYEGKMWKRICVDKSYLCWYAYQSETHVKTCLREIVIES